MALALTTDEKMRRHECTMRVINAFVHMFEKTLQMCIRELSTSHFWATRSRARDHNDDKDEYEELYRTVKYSLNVLEELKKNPVDEFIFVRLSDIIPINQDVKYSLES
tara:strand:- start:494 stop:817 length:324 start_codon:yes stop_codon:yes gene_type:complete